MNDIISIIKGAHPGIILERELRKRKLGKSRFAMSVGEYPQTLVAITKGKRKMNTPLAMKIENALGIEEGFFMTLQMHHDIREEKRRLRGIPDLSKIRKVVFWDTRFDLIDWEQHKGGVIRRIFERGNKEERIEITRFYGQDTIDQILKKK